MASLLKRVDILSASLRLRGLHLLHYWDAETEPVALDPPNQEVSDVAVGVGGVVVYSTGRESSNVWLASLWQEAMPSHYKWACLRLPTPGRVMSVSVGRSHVAMVMDNYNVYTAGSNVFGQCGYHGDNDTEELEFKLVPGSPAKEVACGLDHTLLLTTTGHVTACGWSVDGQTGIGRYDNVYEPISLDVENVLKVATCADSCFALTKTGEVFAWGNNEYGQLGLITSDKQVPSPARLDLSGLDSDVVSVATGGGFTGVLTSSGSVYVCGYTIEDPSLCVREGATVIQPEQLCHFRKLSTGVATVSSLNAGLNYLVAGVHGNSAVSRDLLIWGQSPCNIGKPPFVQLAVDKTVTGIVYGATNILASLTQRTMTNVFTVCA